MKDDQIAGGIFGVAIGDALGVPGERLSMFSSIKGTWHEYGTIVKRLKISQPTVSKSATRGPLIEIRNPR